MQSDPDPIRCALCLYVRTGVAEPATTIIHGTAVCYDHMGFVAQGTEWNVMMRAVQDAEDDSEGPADGI